MDFVTDRTQADVEARNSKGTYNYTDLNRVIANSNTIAQALNDAGIPITLTWSRSNWTRTQIPDDAYMAEFIANVNLIKAALPNNAPDAPASMSYLTFEGANNIEKILQEINTLLNNMLSTFPRSGSAIRGAVIYEVTT